MQGNVPIVLFVYNRPELTLKALSALNENYRSDKSLLIVYADGPKVNPSELDMLKIEQTRNIVRMKQWCHKVEIVESGINKGLSKSIIQGVTEVLNKYEAAIVLEDDLMVGKNFLNYMNNALEKYKSQPEVMQISGFSYPLETPQKKNSAFFLPLTTSWGWGTWKRAWQYFDSTAAGYDLLKNNSRLAYLFDLNGAYPYSKMLIQQMEGSGIDSWAIRWWWTVFKMKGMVLYPGRTLVSNIGFGKDATHTSAPNDSLNIRLDKEVDIQLFPNKISIDKRVFKKVRKFVGIYSSNDEYQNAKKYILQFKKYTWNKVLNLFLNRRKSNIS